MRSEPSVRFVVAVLAPLSLAASCNQAAEPALTVERGAIREHGSGSLGPQGPAPAVPTLVARAVLPAATFARPDSGTLLGAGPINGQPVPFVDKQPVQGFSARAGSSATARSWSWPTTASARIENSADFLLRVYRCRPDFETGAAAAAPSRSRTASQLARPRPQDPLGDHQPLHRTSALLTGADFDIESMQRAPDGTLWIGDEFGPFLLHFDRDAAGCSRRPIRCPTSTAGGAPRSARPRARSTRRAPRVRIMNAVRTHARPTATARRRCSRPGT